MEKHKQFSKQAQITFFLLYFHHQRRKIQLRLIANNEKSNEIHPYMTVVAATPFKCSELTRYDETPVELQSNAIMSMNNG